MSSSDTTVRGAPPRDQDRASDTRRHRRSSADGITPSRGTDDRPSPLVQLTLARFREFIREPEAVFWVFIFPILLASGLGIAFRSRAPERAHVAVLSNVEGSDTIASILRRDHAIDVAVLDDSAAAGALRTGRVALVVAPRGAGEVEYRYDASRDEARTARLLVDGIVQRGAGRRDPLRATDTRVTARGSRYIDFVIPGLLGMNLMGSGIWGVGFSVVDARKRKLLKRFVATPMSRVQYLASYLIQRLAVLFVEVLVLVGFGVVAFGVPVRGSLAVLALIAVLSALCFSGIGLLLASRARTTEAVSGLMNLAMLPMWVLSGVFFSSANFPAALQPFIRALPLTATIDALRANMLEGASLAAAGGELAIILAWMVVSFVLALKLFRWQ